MITMRHERWIRFALKKLQDHYEDGFRCRHVAVLVRGGRLLAVGYNHAKRGKLFSNIFGEKSYHAEIDALEGFRRDELKGATMYVVGMTRQGRVLNSRPCPRCQIVLAGYPLKDVIYLDRGVIRSLWSDEEAVILEKLA